jgi:hypothetical protein
VRVALPSTTTFALPQAHRISIEYRLDCRAIATSFTSERDGHLETEVSIGTDHLTIVRIGKTLKVTAAHEKSGLPDDSDFYTVTRETVDFVSAVQAVKELPVDTV